MVVVVVVVVVVMMMLHSVVYDFILTHYFPPSLFSLFQEELFEKF